jgi:hypothetical protein
MALREVKPLDNKQWTQVKAMMEEGPTDTSIATVKRALERASKIKRKY